MEFKKFSDIELLTPKLIQEIREQGLDGGKWLCTNKLDGSNFQIAIDLNGSVHYGSRNQELGRYDNFNGWQHVIQRDDMENKTRALKAELEKSVLRDIASQGPYVFIAFFELIGGVYRHKDVEPVKGACKLQGRVNYCPDNKLVCIGAFYYQVKEGEDGAGDYLPPLDVNKACDAVGLYHMQIKAELPFDEAIQYPNDYEDTTGVDLFGLPPLEHNITEGVVLLPVIPGRFRNGSRLIAKNKNQIFLERGVKTNKIKNPPEPMNELEEQWFSTYMEYVTESRMMSVLSKMDTSHITGKDFGTLLSAFIEDADKDFQKEYGGTILCLEAEHPVGEFNMHKVTKAAKSEAAKMIRPHFLDFLRQNGVNC